MGRDDWFRNQHWNEAIENAFFAKLARARDKSQYLRIQAYMLREHFPKVALRLLDQYFSMQASVKSYDTIDRASAYQHQAEAHLALGNVEAAINSYEAALTREAEFPNSLTLTYVDFPYLIAIRGLRTLYSRALDILNQTRSRPTFPHEHFRWHCSRALILKELGRHSEARASAQAALAAAGQDRSGFRNHPNIGLVRDLESTLRRRLETLADAPDP